jgi:hypothetical protein
MIESSWAWNGIGWTKFQTAGLGPLALPKHVRAGPVGRIPKETKNQLKQTSILNFRPLRPYFEEEAATSTTSVIHQWKALVKPKTWALIT